MISHNRQTEEKRFAEEVAIALESTGLPRMTGRILGYLLISDPPHQSTDEMMEALMASILGGINTLFGAVLGTGILKTLDVVLSGVTERYVLVMGVMFLVIIMFAPKGIAGSARQIWEAYKGKMLSFLALGNKAAKP